ncbi:hypothetical protein HDV00_010369 [Rhizophlyctis rosea]|nr:hypothetical protein HDV00_010369 [Rhizophlyctis rosea]
MVECQRRGFFETWEKLTDMNNVIDFAKIKNKENSSLAAALKHVSTLLNYTPWEYCGCTEDQLTDLVQRYRDEIKRLEKKHETKRKDNIVPENPKVALIDDWADFAEKALQHYLDAERVYFGGQNVTAKHMYDFRQRLSIILSTLFYNVRSAWRTVKKFNHPGVDISKDNVIFWDQKNPQNICVLWNDTKTLRRGEWFFQSLAGTQICEHLHRYLTSPQMTNNSPYLLPDMDGNGIKQDTFRQHIQDHCQIFYGKPVGIWQMRIKQNTVWMEAYAGGSEAEIEWMSAQFHHSKEEHRLYVQHERNVQLQDPEEQDE